MNKIDKQIFKILDKHFPDEMDSSMYHPNLTEDLVSQIKQSILKAIMERKPKIEHDDWEHDCDGCSILGERRGIERYESVIKEVLR